MAKISKSDFLKGLRKSGIVEPERLDALLENLLEDTPEAIAKQLVRDELATQWQAKYLMSGRSRLDIGSYRLLERIHRDEFGDRFLAVHTSLARKVDIQVLPGSLTKDQSSCDRFIQKASLAAQLDHPNLTHVYDIDQEGGRYYLVTEHVEGKSLEETDASTLSETTIAQIVSQALEGIVYAHQHEVIHGCIGPADLILDDQQQVKIQHLPLSPLRQQFSQTKEKPTTQQDFSAIARIGSFLLQKADMGESRRSELAGVFEMLGEATPESTAASSIALAQFIASALPESNSDFGGFDQPIASTASPRKKKSLAQKEVEEPQEIANPGYLGRLWRDNPVAVIGASLVLALLLVGGSVYGGITFLGSLSPSLATQNGDENPDPVSSSNAAAQSSNESTSDQADGIPTAKEMSDFLTNIENRNQKNGGLGQQQTNEVKQKQVPGDLEKPPATAQTKPAVPATSDKTLVKAVDDKPQVTTPTVNPDDNAVPNTVDSSTVVMTNVVGEPNSTQPANVDGTTPAVAEAEVSKPIHTDLTVIRGIAEKTQAVLQGGEVKSLEQMAAMTPQEIQSALQKGGWGTANKMADYQDWIVQAKALIGDESPMKTSPVNANNGRAPAAEPSGPFANFPRLTSLPPLEDTSEIKIADLVIKRQYLLGAELICEKGAVRGRATFELERSNDDKQKWLVGVKKSPKHDATHIAMFRKSENAFHFQWLDAAAADKNASKMAPFLRNCFVKLILPDDESTLLTLRKPIKIPDLRLTAEALWNEVEIQIPGMPDPASIVVEVLPMRIPNVDTSIPNSRVERFMPARILLKKNDKTGFLWIQVSGELRSKLKLRSNLTLLVQGTPQPVNSLKSLQELAVTLDAAVVRSQIIHDQFTKPPQMNKGDFNKKKAALLKEAKANQAIKQKFNSYGETLPKILNQPISVRVYSKLGNYQTILAVTDPKIEQKKK